MSLKYLNLAFCTAITGTKKGVLIALSDRCNDSGFCYPALSDIALRSGCSTRSVTRAVEELEKIGLLVVVRETGKSNKYILLLSTTQDTMSIDGVIHTLDKVSITPDTETKTLDMVSNKPLEPPLTKERNFFKPGNPKTQKQTNSQAYKIFNKLQNARVNNQSAKGELKNIRALLFGGFNHG